MRTENATRHFIKRPHSLVLMGVFMFVAAAVAVPFYSVRSSSVRNVSSKLNVPSGQSAKASQFNSVASSSSNRTSWSSAFPSLLPIPQATPPPIATYDGATCSVPQSDFFLGDTVCAKASGIPVSLFPWHITWVDPAGFVRQSDTASTNDQTEYRYTLPSDPTTDIDGRTVDNRGTWKVNVTRPNGSVRSTAPFTVHQPANPLSDVFIQKFSRDPSGQVQSGQNIPFIIVVGNSGPDPAVNVHLVDSVPAGGTLVQFTQNSGPQCVVAGDGPPNDCTIAAMTNGDRAEFTAIYNTGSETPGDYQTSATVSSTTTDPNTSNNTATAQYSVTPSTGGTCQLICPDNITTPANTTEGGQRGAHVNYDPPITSGDCGTVTSTPASGSFFPVGTTTVTATSATGGGSCSFTVTVEEHGSTATITCPSDQTADADSNCSATVNIGTATATGDNVTLFATRSDGQPVYTCDANGNCTRNSSDAPFAAGTTTITWSAYSHDVAGPYTTPGPNAGDTFEEQHRTSSASCTQRVTVNDVTPPTIAATDSSASADANCQAAVPDYSNTVSDNCACASSDTSESCQGHPHITYAQDPAAGTMVGLGPHTVHITANDGSSNNGGAGNTSTKDVTFTVNDTTQPTINCPSNKTTNTLPGTCSAAVVTGTATATDNCDSNPTITHTRSDGQPLIALYPKGTTTITWTATDASGNHSSCTQTVTVVDNENPVITFNGQTPSMSPPDHKYHTFTPADFISSVSDNCDPLTINDVYITQATSDEPNHSGGSGNTTPDIVIATDCKSVQLRAERMGGGNGRVYTIYFKLKDSSGNFTTGTAKVIVPVETGGTAVDDGPSFTVTSGCP